MQSAGRLFSCLLEAPFFLTGYHDVRPIFDDCILKLVWGNRSLHRGKHSFIVFCFYETKSHSFAVLCFYETKWHSFAVLCFYKTKWHSFALRSCHGPGWQNSALSFCHGPGWQNSAFKLLPRARLSETSLGVNDQSKGDLERSSRDQARQSFASRPQDLQWSTTRIEQGSCLLTIPILVEGDSFGPAK